MRMRCRGCLSLETVSAPTTMAPFVAERMLDGKRDAEAVECLSCGLLFANVEPTLSQLSRYYQDYWQESYVAHREVYEPDVRTRHSHLLIPRDSGPMVEAFLDNIMELPQSVLDLGGGSGVEAPYRGRATVHVFDPGNAEVVPGVVKVDDPKGPYDLVVLAHVLEHVPNPRELVTTAYSLVDPLGVLYLEVPQEAALYGDRPRLETVSHTRGAWHEHINFFDEISLGALVQGTGGLPIRTEVRNWITGPYVSMAVIPPKT